MALDGRPLGLLQLFDFAGEHDFSELDEAVVMQLAQMASGTLERMALYRRSTGHGSSELRRGSGPAT
jgi:GAF domain-containing protein